MTKKVVGKIDITPMGMRTEEGQQRVAKALKAKEDADLACYRTLQELETLILNNNEYFIDLYLHYNCPVDASSEEEEGYRNEALDFLTDLQAAIDLRDDINKEFVSALAGIPSRQVQ